MRLNPYETPRYLHEYLVLHYGRPRDLCPFPFVPRELLRFHERLRQEYLLPVRRRSQSRGLDLGCAVGRFTFELGRLVGHVLGIDNARSLIRAAQRMAKRHRVTVPVQESGAEFSSRRLVLPDTLQRCNVEFQVGDALDLSALPSGGFQVVSAINLIDRLPRPREFLGQLARLLAPGGQLVIASPFTWLEEFTPSREWFASEQVPRLLGSDFRLARHGDLPFVIREHRRKYQLVVAEVFTFVRRDGAPGLEAPDAHFVRRAKGAAPSETGVEPGWPRPARRCIAATAKPGPYRPRRLPGRAPSPIAGRRRR